MMRALVTGGAGFIGSHLVEKLLDLGYKVVVLDNLYSGNMDNLSFLRKKHIDNFTFIRGDIRNYSDCIKACSEVDIVFHQAALRSVPESVENPQQYNEVNIKGTLNLLKAAKECKVKKFIFASSSAIYGDIDKLPQKETEYPQLISPYALTKLTGEYYCRIFNKIFGLETISLRYFNVYGPRQAPDDEYSAVIPKFITCVLNGETLPIYGSGRQSRDFVYVEDVVRANILAAQKDKLEGEVVNIASGESHSILDLANLLGKIVNKNIKYTFFPQRSGDVFKTLADISKAEKLLGYKPKISFSEGLRRTLEWFKNQLMKVRT